MWRTPGKWEHGLQRTQEGVCAGHGMEEVSLKRWHGVAGLERDEATGEAFQK